MCQTGLQAACKLLFKDVVCLAAYVAPNLYISFCIIGALMDVQITHGAFELCADNKRDGPSVL